MSGEVSEGVKRAAENGRLLICLTLSSKKDYFMPPGIIFGHLIPAACILKQRDIIPRCLENLDFLPKVKEQ
jgi:hypothetical protein